MLSSPRMHARASFRRQLGLLARRSIMRTFRDPGSVAPGVIVPLILFVLVSAGLEKATHVKGFPTHTIWTFTLTIAFANGAMVIVANTGQAIATDIEGGFINRLALTPMRSFALIASQLAGHSCSGSSRRSSSSASGWRPARGSRQGRSVPSSSSSSSLPRCWPSERSGSSSACVPGPGRRCRRSRR